MTHQPVDEGSRVVAVLGAYGGIGSAVAERLHAQGVRLVLGGRDAARLRTMADRLQATALVADATVFDDVQEMVNRAVDTYGRLDGMVLTVGSILLKPAHLTTVDAFAETIERNLYSAFFVVKAAARAMMKDGGAIVLCSSSAAQVGLANHEAIAAAKAGVEGLIRASAATYANRHVRINGVAPGLVDTPLAAGILGSEAGRTQSEAMHPLGRIGRAGDVASAICWLLDDRQSGWVTGQVLGVDGGLARLRTRG